VRVDKIYCTRWLKTNDQEHVANAVLKHVSVTSDMDIHVYIRTGLESRENVCCVWAYSNSLCSFRTHDSTSQQTREHADVSNSSRCYTNLHVM